MTKLLFIFTLSLIVLSIISYRAEASKESRCRDFLAQELITDFQKEEISSIKTIAEHLFLVSIGVFSLLGSYLLNKEKPVHWKTLLIISLSLFLVSAFFGILTIGEIVTQLSCNHFDPYHKRLGVFGLVQQLSVILAGVAFLFFVLKNIESVKGGK